MAVQTTYSERISEALAGAPGDMRAWDAITRTCEESAGIGFGLAVGRGDTDDNYGCKLAGALTAFLGVSKRDNTLEASQGDEYAQYQNVGIQTAGPIWVQVSGTPGPDDPVHYNATTGVFAASGGSGPILGARWMRTAANGLGLVHLPNYDQASS